MNKQNTNDRSRPVHLPEITRPDKRGAQLPRALEQAIKEQSEREMSQDAQPEVTVVEPTTLPVAKLDHRQEEYVHNQAWNPGLAKANREKDAIIDELRTQLEDLKRRVSQLEE